MQRPSPIAALLESYRSGHSDPLAQVNLALAQVNRNASHNTYITVDPEWTRLEAQRQMDRARAGEALPLYGIPVSLKDCFDLAGFPTSIGSRFYATQNPVAAADSWVAARLRKAGAVIIGKSHLHQLAYGITGENPDYGDCLQPANATRLTGGSSSGAAASIQEGSALAAIGTDTGGSVRAPAALCGLAGYRASHGIGDWTGGYHLAESFDTIGWLFRDLRDAPILADALFDFPSNAPLPPRITIGVLTGALLDACDPDVLRTMEVWKDRLLRLSEFQIRLEPVDPAFWSEALDIYAPIQASEAARLHTGLYHHFDPAIAARLEWGASLTDDDVRPLRRRHQEFLRRHAALFEQIDFFLAPAVPQSLLAAGADHTQTRPTFLRLTTPASLGGNPAVVLPAEGGLQLLAGHNHDRRLLQFTRILGESLADEMGE
jgi:aspartyl-tRNA(Asn)/glutamyl-tRNA(Gln) amidotransferase subunit A